MLSVERGVVLVVCRYFACFVVPLRALVVREFPSSRDLGRFGVLYPLLKLDTAIVVD